MFEITPPPRGLHIIDLQQHKVVIDGYVVPGLDAVFKDDQWHFSLDNSWSLDVPEVYGLPVANFVAQAMATAAGLTCFGKGSRRMNPFNHQALYLGAVPENTYRCSAEDPADGGEQ